MAPLLIEESIDTETRSFHQRYVRYPPKDDKGLVDISLVPTEVPSRTPSPNWYEFPCTIALPKIWPCYGNRQAESCPVSPTYFKLEFVPTWLALPQFVPDSERYSSEQSRLFRLAGKWVFVDNKPSAHDLNLNEEVLKITTCAGPVKETFCFDKIRLLNTCRQLWLELVLGEDGTLTFSHPAAARHFDVFHRCLENPADTELLPAVCALIDVRYGVAYALNMAQDLHALAVSVQHEPFQKILEAIIRERQQKWVLESSEASHHGGLVSAAHFVPYEKDSQDEQGNESTVQERAFYILAPLDFSEIQDRKPSADIVLELENVSRDLSELWGWWDEMDW